MKNLENVQGDERDIVIISVCYGPDANGKMLMNFGPINKTGGEKRLNVIFSRAKHHLALVSSIRWVSITNEYNDGANCLRSYLRYAEALSVGDVPGAQLALQFWSARLVNKTERKALTLEKSLARALTEKGYQVDVGVGTSRFRCNLGIRRHGQTQYALGVLLDDEDHYTRPVDEILHAQSGVLRAFGWRTLTVMQRDWYTNRELVLERILIALREQEKNATA